MVEASNADLLAKLQGEINWNMSAIFTDKENVVVANKCTLLPDEIK